MRYRLRTLLIVLALGPLVLAGAWFAIDWKTIRDKNLEFVGLMALFSSIYVAMLAFTFWVGRILNLAPPPDSPDVEHGEGP